MYKYTKIQGPRFQRNYIIARDQKSYSVYTWHVISVIAENKSHAYHKTQLFAYNESLKNIPNSRLEYTNHTLFQTKMVEIDTLFQTKTAKKKHTRWRGTCLYSIYRGLTPFPSRAKNALQIMSLLAYAERD